MEDNNGKYVSNESEILIAKPIEEVYRWVVYEPLEKQLLGTKKIPGVTSTKTINDIELGEIGHRRLVCLADGSTAIEEHTYLEKHDNTGSKSYFSYKVWDYTLKIAQNIEYATGEWWFASVGDKTHIKWRYSFKLNNKKVLGRLGFLGRVLFKKFFIKNSYNANAIKVFRQKS